MSESHLSDENQVVYQTITQIFNRKAALSSRTDENGMGSIDIISASGCPREGIDSYATVGLSDRSIGMILGGIPLGVEIVGACKQAFMEFPDILAACALTVLNGQVKFHPGAVFKNSITAHYRDLEMKHILFVPPYGWEQEFLTLDLPTKKVAWLMALPISDAELKFINETESGELESLFEQKHIDMYDLERKSVL